MKNVILSLVLFYCSFLSGQNGVLIPPDQVVDAFSKKYPDRKAIWNLEYTGKKDDVTFEAKFSEKNKKTALALFDQKGTFISYKLQIEMVELPVKAQAHIRKNYSVKSLKQSFLVLNAANDKTYEAAVIKDKKNYNLLFDKEGELIKRIQIR